MISASIAAVLISATWAFIADRTIAQRRTRDAIMTKALEQAEGKMAELKNLEDSVHRLQERMGRLEMNMPRKF